MLGQILLLFKNHGESLSVAFLAYISIKIVTKLSSQLRNSSSARQQVHNLINTLE